VVIFPTLLTAMVAVGAAWSEGKLGDPVRHEVRYADHGVEYAGIYKVTGWMLELTSSYGTLRVPLGLFEEKALARKLLRAQVRKAAREVEVSDDVPHPATIVATEPTRLVMRVPKL
jgi:hypothetical protein